MLQTFRTIISVLITVLVILDSLFAQMLRNQQPQPC